MREIEKELRSQQVQLKASGKKITGIIKYNTRSNLIGSNFYEVISPKAFQYDTVKALWNHDTNIVLGSTRSNTLRLKDTTEGLNFEIDIPESRADILENIYRGDVDGTSFGMQVLEDSWNYDEEYPVRTIIKAELYEISPTPFPAYEGNTVSTRAMEQIKNKNNKKGGKNIMNEQLKKILAMLAEGKATEEIQAEIEKMLSTEEPKQEDAAAQTQLRSILAGLKNNNKDSNSMNKEELRTLMAEIQTEEVTKNELRSAIFSQAPLTKVASENEFRSAFRSIVTGSPMGVTELRAIGISTGEGGGYLIGDAFYNKIIEMKRSMTDLSTYFNVMPVGEKSGILPVEVLSDMVPMEVVGEGKPNKDGQDPKFKQVKYDVKDMREVYKLANSFVKDQKVDIMGYLQRKIALKDVYSTNYYILNGFDATKKEGLLNNPVYKTEKIPTGVTLKKIQELLTSFDPAVRDGLILITNSDGFAYLSSLTYTDGRLVMQENATLASGHTFLGKEIVELSNKLLPTNATDGVPFIICHKDAVTVFERQAYEVKASEEAGFDDDSTKVRVTVRKDIKTGIDEESARILYSKIA